MKQRPIIARRQPVYFGCEGESEVGYGALLHRLADEAEGVHLHILPDRLQPGAGDPHALVTRAVQRITDLEKRRVPFVHKAVLLDIGTTQKNQAAQKLAAENGIDHLIWQAPDHEAFLLHHLDNCQQLKPAAGTTLTALRKEWAGYEKGRTHIQLSERIILAHVRQACAVEPDLDTFLKAIGLIQ
jgi:hypothetical protein